MYITCIGKFKNYFFLKRSVPFEDPYALFIPFLILFSPEARAFEIK